MLNWNPRCKPIEFAGGKIKFIIGRSGRSVRNHWLIDIGYGVALQSYNSIVAFRFTENCGKFKRGDVLLDRGTWDCSQTTARYRRLFLEEGIVATREKIKTGEYQLKALNFIRSFGRFICPTDFH